MPILGKRNYYQYISRSIASMDATFYVAADVVFDKYLIHILLAVFRLHHFGKSATIHFPID